MTTLYVHQILYHVGLKTINYIQNIYRDIIINQFILTSNTFSCKMYSLSKGHLIISRSSKKEYTLSKKPFEHCFFDLIKMFFIYNKDNYISYLRCKTTKFQFIYTFLYKSNCNIALDKSINIIKA